MKTSQLIMLVVYYYTVHSGRIFVCSYVIPSFLLLFRLDPAV